MLLVCYSNQEVAQQNPVPESCSLPLQNIHRTLQRHNRDEDETKSSNPLDLIDQYLL